jgi:RNA recognition motif. (a.k.a. RRM, RBD, or RNP domain)
MCCLKLTVLFDQELFGDVGPLKSARLQRPGAADVIFVNVEDALAAVKMYHTRELDGNSYNFVELY